MSTKTSVTTGRMDEAESGSAVRLHPVVSTSGPSCPNHNFVEEYYGWRCSKCGQFYPNTAPLENWLVGESYDRVPTAECPRCGCEVGMDGYGDDCEAKRLESRALDKLNAVASLGEDDETAF